MPYNAAQPKRPSPHTGDVLSGVRPEHPETKDAAPFPPDAPVPVEAIGYTTTTGTEAEEGW